MEGLETAIRSRVQNALLNSLHDYDYLFFSKFDGCGQYIWLAGGLN